MTLQRWPAGADIVMPSGNIWMSDVHECYKIALVGHGECYVSRRYLVPKWNPEDWARDRDAEKPREEVT